MCRNWAKKNQNEEDVIFTYRVLISTSPLLTLPGTCCCRVTVGTGWPGVNVPLPDGIASLICNFYLSVAARAIVSSVSHVAWT